MKITVLDNRDVIIDINDNFGTENENNATTLNLSVPDIYSNANKKIVFLTDDGNFWDLIQNNSYKITNAITKYKNISAYIWITDSEKEIDFRSRTFDITFNSNQEPDDITPSPEEISIWDTMITQLNNGLDTLNRETLKLEDALEEVDNIDIDGSKTGNVATITITRKDGTEKEVQILDGTDYVITEDDYEEIANIVEEDITPLIPTKVSDLDNDSGFIDANVNNLVNYTLKTNTGSSIELSINSSTYVMTLKLKNSNGNVISTGNVDLPLETMVVGARYDATNRMIILTLQNGTEVSFSVADLVSGLQTEITSSNKLSSDLVDDTNNLNKFVTEQEKTTWNNKSDFSGSYNDLTNKPDLSLKEDNSNKVSFLSQSSTNIQYPGAKLVYDELQIKERQIQALESIANDLYNAFPKTPYGEGTSITLENTKAGKLDYENNIVGYGDTLQEGTPTPESPIPIQVVTGTQEVVVKGLSEIDFSTYTTKGNTTTYNFSNNIINITSTGKSQRVIWNILDLVKNNAGKTIRFYYKNIDVTNQYGTSFIRLSITNNGVDTTINLLTHSLEANTYTIPSDVSGITNAIFYIYSNSYSSTEYNASVMIEEPMLYLGESDVTSYEPYITPTTKTIHLGNLELAGIGDIRDEILFDENEGKWYKKKAIEKISSYNGETITTDYISTTGQLTTGATIYYVIIETLEEITDTTLIEELDELLYMKSLDNLTIIETSGNLPMILKVRALKGE